MKEQTIAQHLADDLRAELLFAHASPYKTVNVSKRLLNESAAELRRLSAIEQQRDQLLSVLVYLCSFDLLPQDKWDTARETIAKVKGAD